MLSQVNTIAFASTEVTNGIAIKGRTHEQQANRKSTTRKTDRSKYRIVHGTELHKGFYCDDNNFANLREIDYDGHLTQINDEEHLTSAECLLRGSCQAFALKVEAILGYRAFIIEACDGKGQHVFCQATLNGKNAFIDARGVTTSFDEFMEVAAEFVKGPFVIRLIDKDDAAEWQRNSDTNSHEEYLALAEAVIKANIECYRLD